jgi:hypothetical protein
VRGLGREISRTFMVRVVLAALTDGLLDLARTVFFFFISDPLYF